MPLPPLRLCVSVHLWFLPMHGGNVMPSRLQTVSSLVAQVLIQLQLHETFPRVKSTKRSRLISAA